MEAQATPAPVAATAGPLRGIQLFLGAFSIVVGLVALLWPKQTVVFVAALFGVQLIVMGLVQLVRTFAVPDTPAGGRWVTALSGLLALVIGLLCLRHLLQTVVAVTLLLGLFWLVQGLVEVVRAVLDGVGSNLLPLVVGLTGALAGTVVLVWPEPTAVVLALVFGLWMVLFGSLTLMRGLRAPA